MERLPLVTFFAGSLYWKGGPIVVDLAVQLIGEDPVMGPSLPEGIILQGRSGNQKGDFILLFDDFLDVGLFDDFSHGGIDVVVDEDCLVDKFFPRSVDSLDGDHISKGVILHLHFSHSLDDDGILNVLGEVVGKDSKEDGSKEDEKQGFLPAFLDEGPGSCHDFSDAACGILDQDEFALAGEKDCPVFEGLDSDSGEEQVLFWKTVRIFLQ